MAFEETLGNLRNHKPPSQKSDEKKCTVASRSFINRTLPKRWSLRFRDRKVQTAKLCHLKIGENLSEHMSQLTMSGIICLS
ncbi:hypothetical protein ACU8KH_02864 [Lachancea thermotolerans]